MLEKLEALPFRTLVPGHGDIQHDRAYVDLLIETFQTASSQMNASLAKGDTKEQAIAAMGLSSVDAKFTHGDPFLANRFQDYVAAALPEAAYLIESGVGIQESF